MSGGHIRGVNRDRGGFCPRRTILDKLLLDAAAEAGAEVREAYTVDELVWSSDRVVGIEGHARHGQRTGERGRIVIDADGCHSVVAKAVRAREYDAIRPLTTFYYSYYSGFDDVALGLENIISHADSPDVLDRSGRPAVTADDCVIDLGSGDGWMVIAAAKRGARALGVEFNPEMVKLAQQLAKEAGVSDRATFVEGDMFEADLSKAPCWRCSCCPKT